MTERSFTETRLVSSSRVEIQLAQAKEDRVSGADHLRTNLATICCMTREESLPWPTGEQTPITLSSTVSSCFIQTVFFKYSQLSCFFLLLFHWIEFDLTFNYNNSYLCTSSSLEQCLDCFWTCNLWHGHIEQDGEGTNKGKERKANRGYHHSQGHYSRKPNSSSHLIQSLSLSRRTSQEPNERDTCSDRTLSVRDDDLPKNKQSFSRRQQSACHPSVKKKALPQQKNIKQQQTIQTPSSTPF